MDLGNIFGSLSPAYGMLSGNGLFGKMGGMGGFGLAGLLSKLFGGHQAQPAPVNLGTQPGTLSTSAADQANIAGMPGMASPGVGGALGSALGAGHNQDPGVQLTDPNFGLQPQSNGLGQLLAQLLGS
jgi:hypothetical protein